MSERQGVISMVVSGFESGWSGCGSDGLGGIQVSDSHSWVEGGEARDKLT